MREYFEDDNLHIPEDIRILSDKEILERIAKFEQVASATGKNCENGRNKASKKLASVIEQNSSKEILD